jgi:hypothetical protein
MKTIEEMRNDVSAVNTILRESVLTMDAEALLCNCHPNYRSDYAYRLLKEGVISKETASKFTKVV